MSNVFRELLQLSNRDARTLAEVFLNFRLQEELLLGYPFEGFDSPFVCGLLIVVVAFL